MMPYKNLNQLCELFLLQMKFWRRMGDKSQQEIARKTKVVPIISTTSTMEATVAVLTHLSLFYYYYAL